MLKKKVFYWSAAVIIFQAAAYLYLDRVVFAPTASFSQETIISGRNVKSLLAAENNAFIRVMGDEVQLYLNEQGFVREYELQDEGEVSSFNLQGEDDLVLIGINTDSGPLVLLADYLQNSDPPVRYVLENASKGARLVSAVNIGPEKKFYTLFQSGSDFGIYQADEKSRLRKVSIETSQIGRIAGMNNQPVLLFDSKTRGIVYQLDPKGRVKALAPGKGRFALLAVDRWDKVYLANLNDKNKATAIIAGDLNGKFSEIEKFTPPVPVDSLKISRDGKLFY